MYKHKIQLPKLYVLEKNDNKIQKREKYRS